MDRSRTRPDGLKTVDACRVATAGPGEPGVPEACEVAVEAPLTIEVADAGSYTLMCTPVETRALAVGFLFTEGMIERRDDILLLAECPDAAHVLRVQLADASKAPERNLAVMSACGLCGAMDIEERLAGLPRAGNSLCVPAERLRTVSQTVRQKQEMFSQSGGTHSAAIFAAEGEIISFAEDVGRHNALDKAIGKCVLEGRPTAGCGAALSGRASLEMVVKCARAGLEVASAVSAPTSLAIEAAARFGITLCAYVRGTRATIFTCPERIGGPHPD